MISKSFSLRTLFFNLLLLTFAVSFGAISQADSGAQQSSSLKKVDPQYVCMMTDKEFAKEQIPVEVEGKTYYGCCEMCKAKIKNNPHNREATDPVSGNNVDKAEAVIGAAPNGSVFYFENEDNLVQYDPTSVN